MGRHHLQRVVGVTRGSTLIWRGSVQVGPRHSTVAYQLGKEHFLDEGKNEGSEFQSPCCLHDGGTFVAQCG